MPKTANLMKTCFFLLLSMMSVSIAQAVERPNLLFIYTDDQRYDAMSVVQKEQGERGRFPWFKTPNMDRLAAEGVRFRNAFVVCSLCSPSRAVNLTGRYNHLNGVASNFRQFPADNVTHASLLRAAGYTTAYVGKWHMDSQRERPGFDHHYSFIAHARYWDPTFIVDGKDTPTKGWVDDISTDYAIEFMKGQKGSGKPWLLVVGFKSPHGPFEPALRAKDRFTGELARAVPNLNTPASYMGSGARNRTVDPAAATVPVNLDYFRCISGADDCLGRLLDALDELGLAKNAVVIYTSDNGYYLGEHGLGDKRSAYDESLRVPFIVRDPTLDAGARGRVVNEMVLNLDLAQTLLDFAGVPAPKEMQGRSWRPLLKDQRTAWRQSWFYEYFAENQKNSRVPDITAVRTTDAKLVKYPGHNEWTELFDIETDPYEMHNIWLDPKYTPVRARLEAEHDRLAKEVGYRVPEYVDRPPWWGKAGGPDSKPDAKPDLRLHFDFATIQDNRVLDLCGHNNHGQVKSGVLVDGRDGRKALYLQGNGFVEVPKSDSLDPTDIAWTAEVVFKPEKPNGMILARGGRSQGYALWLREGRLVFTVVIDSKPVTVEAKKAVTEWTTVVGTITSDRKATLHVDGRLVAEAALPGLIQRNPSDTMQIGADMGSTVVEPAPPKFFGWIERVRLFSSEWKP